MKKQFRFRQEHNDPMDPYNTTEKSTWAFGRREKVLVAATLILLVVMFMKSIFLDAYKPVEIDEMSEIEMFIDEQYDGFFYENKILKVRLIEYKNEDDETILHLRRYFLGVFPIGDVYTGF